MERFATKAEAKRWSRLVESEKDTSGPSLNILIKVLAVTSLAIVALP